jgi:hypothetical protein
MAAPEPSVVELTNGYHPLGPDLPRILAGRWFDELLAVGTGLPDVVDLVGGADGVRPTGRAAHGRLLVYGG